MAAITLHASGSAPADVAWQRYADTREWATWSPQIGRVATDGRDRIVPGLTGSVHGPAGLAVRFVVLDVDPTARTWTWQIQWGPAQLRLEHTVTDVAEGSATALTMRGPLPILLAYVPIARLALHRLVS